MLKKNKGFFIITSVITLLPILAGFLLWNRLPAQVPTHFRSDGSADGYSGKLVAVLGIYLFCFACHVLCAVLTAADPKGKNISQKIYRLILCICPVVSIYAAITIYGNALGHHWVEDTVWINGLMAVLLIVIGNYLPKCRQNYTIGIKLPWTLADEDNWNYTHRLAGKWMMLGGVLVLLAGLQSWVDPVEAAVIIIVVVVLVPSVASYLYYRRHSAYK